MACRSHYSFLANYVQKRTGTLEMSDMGGLASKSPVLAAFFVAATMASIGLPGFANFLGEFSIFNALWAKSGWLVAFAALGILISAIYGLRAVSASSLVNLQPNSLRSGKIKRLEILIFGSEYLLFSYLLSCPDRNEAPTHIGRHQHHVKSLQYEDTAPEMPEINVSSSIKVDNHNNGHDH